MSSRKSNSTEQGVIVSAWDSSNMSEMGNKRVTFSRFQRMSRRSVLSEWMGKAYSRKQRF